MSLRDVKLKRAYDSDFDDVLSDFYIPVLSQAVDYKRLAGFFSSTSLAVAAKGISKLIRNGGRMKLICCARLSKADVEMIQEAQENLMNAIEKVMIRDVEDLENEFVRDHVRALGWMIANEQLNIKVAIVCDEKGYPLDKEIIEKKGIFHQKVGILEDIDGNRVSFSGSVNESATGWLGNIEEFKVFRSWVDPENEYFSADHEKFEKYWRGSPTRTKVIEIPTAVREKLIEISPQRIDEINLGKWLRKKIKNKIMVTLWNHQNQAITNWLQNDGRGIFEMATGTGKTFAALGCLKKVLEKNDKLVTIVACPYDHLVRQWLADIREFNVQSDVIVADSANFGWEDELADSLSDVNNGIRERLIILTTHSTFSTDKFINMIKTTHGRLLLIADEVHGAGAPIRKGGLLEDYKLRLGLSATPRRWFDDKGTNELFQYFGGTIFEFGLKDAINSINPNTGKTYLVPYEYKPYFVGLTDDELLQYEEESQRIARLYHRTNDNEQAEKLFSLLCIKRQRIVRNATQKYDALDRILSDIGSVRNCLVYCSPEQLATVQDLFNEKGIIQHKFTFHEGTHPDRKYGGISEREFLLRKFAQGKYQALIAMRCLDEGVDVPPAKIAIILASSGNPREYIQRRGRVLRRFPGKEKAIIYDVIVVPILSVPPDENFADLERKILQRELRRYKEFSLTAGNVIECLAKIESIEEKCRVIV